MRICLCKVSDSSHSHTLPITCTCCYDEIKGTQDQDLFSSSFSDSHSHTSLTHMLITCTCCDDQIKGTQDKDFSYSFSDSLSHFSHTHTFALFLSPNVARFVVSVVLFSQVQQIVKDAGVNKLTIPELKGKMQAKTQSEKVYNTIALKKYLEHFPQASVFQLLQCVMCREHCLKL